MTSFPFPTELTILILEALDVPSLLRCMQVCKQFQSIIQENSALLYKVSLFSAQMSDVKHCDWDFPSRLEAIRRHTDAWKNLQFPTRKQIPMEDGLVINNGQAWDLASGILAQARPNGGISCVQMPCSIKGIPERRWVVLTEIPLFNFTIDVTQDLLVAIELVDDAMHAKRCDVHLRSFTTGMVHPRATCSRITPTFFDEQFESYVLIGVCGPHVGIFFGDIWASHTMTAFAIWDWRNGNQTMFIELPEFTSFTFISDELVLVSFVDDDDDEQVSLRILAVPPGNYVSSAGDVEYLCEFRYPRLRASCNVNDVFITPALLTASAVPDIPAAPFAHSSTDVLFTVTFKYAIDSDVETVVLLVPRSTILNQVSSIAGSSQKYLEWESWGPAGSRMLKLNPSDIWACHSHGMKFIYSPDGGTFARLFDFNPYASRKDVNTASCPHLPWKAMSMATKIRRRRGPFDTDVVTSLPGREASILLTPNNNGWESTMITEDHIVMVQSEHRPAIFAYMAM